MTDIEDRRDFYRTLDEAGLKRALDGYATHFTPDGLVVTDVVRPCYVVPYKPQGGLVAVTNSAESGDAPMPDENRPWTPEEDTRLIRLRRQFQHEYRRIAKALQRPADACQERYRTITKRKGTGTAWRAGK
jgi:hypothetical protein